MLTEPFLELSFLILFAADQGRIRQKPVPEAAGRSGYGAKTETRSGEATMEGTVGECCHDCCKVLQLVQVWILVAGHESILPLVGCCRRPYGASRNAPRTVIGCALDSLVSEVDGSCFFVKSESVPCLSFSPTFKLLLLHGCACRKNH